MVISQVFGGGGNSTAPFKNDFVELFNRSASPVSLAGWSVQYASATGTGTFGQNGVVALSGTLQPGQRYLVQLAGGTTGAALPTPDATGNINMSATAGKVVLARVATGLTCNSTASCTTSGELGNIVDAVGFGTQTAPINEGSAAAPTLTNSTGALRALGGCTDTNQNGSDFSAGAPNPHNTASAQTPCSGGNVAPQVTSTTPSNGAANVGVASDIAINFSESVTASGSWFSMSCAASGSVSATITGGPQNYVLNSTIDLQAAETCTVTVDAASVVDADGLAMPSNYVFSFTTAAPVTGTPIHTIQGAGHVSPLNGTTLTTHGIVTGVDDKGYFIQDPVADADPATSEGIFVFLNAAPTVLVGDDVQVTGKVQEFHAATDSLPQTEISSVTAQTVLASGQPLPAPIVVGQGGRVPPTSIIEDDAVGDVETVAGTFDWQNDGLDFYEALESMRVQVSNVVAVGPQATFSSGSKELPVLLDSGVGAGPRTPRGGIIISPSDFNPERLSLANDLLATMPAANVGDSLPGTIVGVMSYTFGNPKLFYTQALPAVVPGGLAKEASTWSAPGAKELDIAAFNVENLDPTDPDSKFDDLATIIVTNLKSPDIIALEEIQDNDGATNSSVVDSSQTLSKLVGKVQSKDPVAQYQTAWVNPVDDQDGGEPGGNIRVAFMYRTDRGVGFVTRQGGPLDKNEVTTTNGVELKFNPGRIDPTNSAFGSSRKPLAGQFTFKGQQLFVIANHFNSKGGDNPLFGRFQPPVLSSETQRNSQALAVKGFVSSLLAADANAPIVVLGDLNDFEFSNPLLTLKSAGLSDLIERLPQNERYTYDYQGNSQALDHIMVSQSLTAHVVDYDVLHVNSEFADQASDHDPGLARLSFDRTPPVVTGPAVNPVVTASGPNGATVTYSVTATDDQDGTLPVTCTPPSGSTFAIGTTTVSCTATDRGGNVTHLEFPVTVSASAPRNAVPAVPGGMLGALAALLFALGRRKKQA